jgi:hypothetical protein
MEASLDSFVGFSYRICVVSGLRTANFHLFQKGVFSFLSSAARQPRHMRPEHRSVKKRESLLPGCRFVATEPVQGL